MEQPAADLANGTSRYYRAHALIGQHVLAISMLQGLAPCLCWGISFSAIFCRSGKFWPLRKMVPLSDSQVRIRRRLVRLFPCPVGCPHSLPIQSNFLHADQDTVTVTVISLFRERKRQDQFVSSPPFSHSCHHTFRPGKRKPE
jgi:hypothetical protein